MYNSHFVIKKEITENSNKNKNQSENKKEK